MTLGNIADSVEYLRFGIFYQHYAGEVDRLTYDQGPKIKWFYWEDNSTLFDADHKYLVFDERDELAVSGPDRAALWSEHAKTAWLRDGHMGWWLPEMPETARHLVGHWYVVFLTE